MSAVLRYSRCISSNPNALYRNEPLLMLRRRRHPRLWVCAMLMRLVHNIQTGNATSVQHPLSLRRAPDPSSVLIVIRGMSVAWFQLPTTCWHSRRVEQTTRKTRSGAPKTFGSFSPPPNAWLYCREGKMPASIWAFGPFGSVLCEIRGCSICDDVGMLSPFLTFGRPAHHPPSHKSA